MKSINKQDIGMKMEDGVFQLNFDETSILELQVLNGDIYLDKFSDFSKCEQDWKSLDVSVKDFKSCVDTGVKISTQMEMFDHLEILDWEFIKEKLAEGKIVQIIGTFYRVKSSMPKCPLCACSYEDGQESTSRRDNITKICSDCGFIEALNDMSGVR